MLGDAKVRVRDVPHTGLTNGYRVELDGATVVYISDHQMPLDGSHEISDAVLELCDGADLLTTFIASFSSPPLPTRS